MSTRPYYLRGLMDALQAVEGNVDSRLRLYRYQPRGVPQLPCLWNMVTGGTATWHTVAHRQDVFEVAVRVGVRYTEDEEDAPLLEELADATIDELDTAMAPGGALGGYVQWSDRTGFRTVPIEINGVAVLAFEAPVAATLRRVVQQ